MKFMKLGSKPDTFQADGKSNNRFVSSELATDVTIKVDEVKFYLHKFPLLSKCNCIQKLVLKASEENSDEISMIDFPGGPKAFEICAKFCYGMMVTLNAYNVVAARCAAEYLEMTEDVDRGNLIFKIEVFLTSGIFCSWKDSIIALQTTRSLLPWSEELKLVGRCIDSIASKTSVDPANITWSYTYNRKLSVPHKVDDINFQQKIEAVPRDWWVEDICELEIIFYKLIMVSIKSKGRMDGAVIGEALKTYAVRWLPESYDDLVSDDRTRMYKYLVETLIYLLPSDKHGGCPCGFLLKMLKIAVLVGVNDSSREDLVLRISIRLHEVAIKDLFIPAQPPQTTLYDVDLVLCMVNRYVIQEKNNWDSNVERNGIETFGSGKGHGSLLMVGKLIDGYLIEIAHDPNLSVANFIEVASSIPDSVRSSHDGLYKAIDIFLKEHPSVTKAERKKICGVMDVKRLTMDASMHAAQNEQLPLRVVVQVLFFEQLRAAAGVQAVDNNACDTPNLTANTDEECEKPAANDHKSLNKHMSRLKIDELPKNGKLAKQSSKNSKSGAQLLPSRSRRIFYMLWSVGKGHGENRSSDTSGSSHSPTSMVPGDKKSPGSSLRNRRNSVS
uniref:BTB/POZ domain-containing protein NPY1-like n=2 Tax=Rhizophora mucronata TaxID=61149 RepID=A0A2P2IKJ7_RHIMU